MPRSGQTPDRFETRRRGGHWPRSRVGRRQGAVSPSPDAVWRGSRLGRRSRQLATERGHPCPARVSAVTNRPSAPGSATSKSAPTPRRAGAASPYPLHCRLPLRLTRTSSAHSVASPLPGSATCAQRSLQSFLRSGFGILSTPPADRLTSTDVSAVGARGPTCPAGAAVPGPRGQGVVVRTAPERLLPVTVRDECGRSRGGTDRSCRHAARRRMT